METLNIEKYRAPWELIISTQQKAEIIQILRDKKPSWFPVSHDTLRKMLIYNGVRPESFEV